LTSEKGWEEFRPTALERRHKVIRRFTPFHRRKRARCHPIEKTWLVVGVSYLLSLVLLSFVAFLVLSLLLVLLLLLTVAERM